MGKPIEVASESSKQIFQDHFFLKLRPYGQPGPLPIGGFPPLLIELKAQFYKLVTL